MVKSVNNDFQRRGWGQMTVGQRVFELLKQRGMTQKEFSEKTGIATTTISDWRKKNTNPGSDKILLICAALEVTPEYLLSGVSEDSDRGRSFCPDHRPLPRREPFGMLGEGVKSR